MGKIATSLGKVGNSGFQLWGKVKAAPLVAQEKEEAASKKAEETKAKADAAHADRVKKATELSAARGSHRVALEQEKQKTLIEQQNLVKEKVKEKQTPRAPAAKPSSKPAAAKAPKPAAAKAPKPAAKTPTTPKPKVTTAKSPVAKQPKPVATTSTKRKTA